MMYMVDASPVGQGQSILLSDKDRIRVFDTFSGELKHSFSFEGRYFLIDPGFIGYRLWGEEKVLRYSEEEKRWWKTERRAGFAFVNLETGAHFAYKAPPGWELILYDGIQYSRGSNYVTFRIQRLLRTDGEPYNRVHERRLLIYDLIKQEVVRTIEPEGIVVHSQQSLRDDIIDDLAPLTGRFGLLMPAECSSNRKVGRRCSAEFPKKRPVVVDLETGDVLYERPVIKERYEINIALENDSIDVLNGKSTVLLADARVLEFKKDNTLEVYPSLAETEPRTISGFDQSIESAEWNGDLLFVATTSGAEYQVNLNEGSLVELSGPRGEKPYILERVASVDSRHYYIVYQKHPDGRRQIGLIEKDNAGITGFFHARNENGKEYHVGFRHASWVGVYRGLPVAVETEQVAGKESGLAGPTSMLVFRDWPSLMGYYSRKHPPLEQWSDLVEDQDSE